MLIFQPSLLDDSIRAVDQTKIFFYNVNDFIKLSRRNGLFTMRLSEFQYVTPG